MSKLILISVVIAMFVIPIRASNEKDVKKGLRKVITQVLLYELFYVFALRFLWGRFD